MLHTVFIIIFVQYKLYQRASGDKVGKVLNFNGLKGWKSNFGHFSSKYAGISLFQFDITELFNIELME